MHVCMRKWNDAKFWRKEVLATVRGRKNAHQLERRLIGYYNPSLNTF